MPQETNLENSTELTSAMENAAKTAGLEILSVEAGTDLAGEPTAVFTFGLHSETEAHRTLRLELSHDFDFHKPSLLPEMTHFLRSAALRLRNPRPDCYVTMKGLPIRFHEFAWPFHHSRSGADTYLVHGTVRLEDGGESPLHAKIAASMTLTFAEIVTAPEQPYAESFIYNAIRKTLDQGQVELIKSGGRQPVMVTTRFYSRWQKKFVFVNTDAQGRKEFLARKLYWLSGAFGGGQPVWLADPTDARYVDASEDDLRQLAAELAKEGLAEPAGDHDFAAATPRLMERGELYQTEMREALEHTKPSFNEEMRAGHTNM
jgi:hypothetical protein